MTPFPWLHCDNIARVDGDDRRALLNLDRLEQPAVLLEGAALLIHDTVNGHRSSLDIIEHLSHQFPEVADLADQVTTCLEELAATGMIRHPSSTPKNPASST